MKGIASCLLFVATLMLVGAGSPHSRYSEGQIWEYRARAVDTASVLRIQKIELMDIAGHNEKIYHVSVVGLRFPGAPDAGGELQHIPVSEATLDASVTRLAHTSRAFPDPNAGIAEWRKANGGVFTIPIADIVASIETMMVQSQPARGGT